MPDRKKTVSKDEKQLRVITVNVNGIRAAARKGFYQWLKIQDADVICIQETKAQQAQLTDTVFHPEAYSSYFHDAEKKGYSGVAIYSRIPVKDVKIGFGWPDIDSEGRYLQIDFDKLSIASLYMPSGSSKEERQLVKYDMMSRFQQRLLEQLSDSRDYIICGDWNIAHKKIDIKNWRGNQKNSGFLPEERAWMDALFDDLGYIDTFRRVNSAADEFTWWSNRGQAWANNVGWRIDYQIATPGLKNTVLAASIYRDERFSDHAPLIVDYAIDPQLLVSRL